MGKFQFAGTMQGRAGDVSRYGTVRSGMNATVGGWYGMVETRVWHNRETGKDMFKVLLIPHWQDSGQSVLLAEGILDHRIEDPFIVPSIFA